MAEPVTVLWLLDEPDLPVLRDERFRHAFGNPDRPAAAIAGLLAQGAVLAVVRTEEEAQRALAQGADEVILGADVSGAPFEKVVERTAARARARFHRDLFLIDLVRKDDTSALALLATSLGHEIIEPLKRATEDSEELVHELDGSAAPALRALAIAHTVSRVARVVERMRELVSTEPADEVVDICEVTREIVQSLARSIEPAAELELEIVEASQLVGMPRWQAAMMIASLISNAVEAVVKRGGLGCKIRVCVSVQEEAAVLEVTDNGLGMDENDRAYAADPFYTSNGKGHLGLGLTLVASRVRRVGGELIIESDPGVGTTVRVFLPLVAASSGTAPSS